MRRAMSLVVLICLVLILCSPAMAAEREGGRGLISPGGTVGLVFDLLWKGAIPLFLGLFARKGREKKVKESALEALETGVTDAYENFVRPLKRDKDEHPDGKLKDSERGDARQWAFNKALEFATGGGRRLLVRWGIKRVSSLIEGIVSRRKKRKEKNA